MSEHEPLSPDLAALLEKEKDGYAHYESGKDAAYGRILERAALLGSIPTDAPAPGATTSAAAAAKTGAAISARTAVLIGAVALLVGGIVGRVTAPVSAPAPVPSASVVVVAPKGSDGALSTTVPSSVPPEPVPSASVAPSASARPSSSVAPAASHAGHGTLAQERDLVEASRTALARQRPADALAAADLHAREFPKGQLAEEREVLAITALVSLGRNAEARARRARFQRDFPNSMLSPPVPPGDSP